MNDKLDIQVVVYHLILDGLVTSILTPKEVTAGRWIVIYLNTQRVWLKDWNYTRVLSYLNRHGYAKGMPDYSMSTVKDEHGFPVFLPDLTGVTLKEYTSAIKQLT